MKIRTGFIIGALATLAACGPQNSSNSSDSFDHNLKSASGIVGGENATPLDQLAVVKIVDGFNRSCTGTLISRDIVLTAAHCVKDAGDLDIIFAADPEVSIPSKALLAHEDYKTSVEGVLKLKTEHTNDIGLILLSKNAPAKAVAALMTEKVTRPGTLSVRAVGYGRTGSDNNDGGILRAVDLDGVVREGDEKHYFFDQTIGKGICKGDSGGPLFIYTGDIPVVVGVVNGSDDSDAFFGEPVGDQCLYTGVATQVAAHKDWIIKNSHALRKKFAPKGDSTFEKGMTTDLALCRKPFPTHEEMKAEILALTAANPTGKSGVGGLAIKDEDPRLIEAYRYLTSYKTYQFKVQMEIDNWLIFKDLKCDKALCGAEEVFGPEDGVMYLYVAAKYGLVLSALGFDKLKPPTEKDQTEFDAYFKVRSWKKGELEPYLRALPMLPSLGLPLPYTRMNHAGITNPVNANVLSNGIIQFYSPMDKMSDSDKEHTTYHEIAHNYGTYYGIDSSAEWLKVSGWKEVNKKFINERPEEFVTRYAASNFFEDFAESFTYYRYYPQTLKEKSPTRYEFLKNKIFSGKEFTSEAACLN